MLPEIGAYPPDERRFSQASLKSIHIVEQLGPRVPLLPRRRFDFFGGHHGAIITTGRHTLEISYDEVAQSMKASVITFSPELGCVLQKRKYKADNGGRFKLEVETPYLGGKLRQVHKDGGFRTKIHSDTVFELEVLEEILNEVLPQTVQ